jgi:uncharacterized damage-inducible protein DinB
MRETLRKMFEYKAWANGELLIAMGRLDGASRSSEMAVRVLNHTFIVDQIFAAHLRGTSHAYEAANAAEVPTLAEISQAVRASDRAYVDYVPTLDEAQLAESIDFTFTDGAPGRMTREEMLMHLIVHGSLHRGQIGWIMMLEGVQPPGDGVTGYLHKVEAATRRRTADGGVATAPGQKLAPSAP